MGYIGTKIYGNCDGYFTGCDSTTKIIIAEGKKWILCAYTSEGCDLVRAVNFKSEEVKDNCIEKWSLYDDTDEDLSNISQWY